MSTTTRRILQAISFTGLGLSLVPSFLVFGGLLSKEMYFHCMTVGMLLWFGTAVFWIRSDHLG